MRKAVNIMFLGGAKRVSMGRKFIDAGRRLGLDVNLFSYELNGYVPIAEIATVVKGCRWADAVLFEHLRTTVRENQIDILIPFVDPAIEVAAKYCASDEECFTPGSDASAASMLFDKAVADEAFRKCGFPVPENPKYEEFQGRIIAKPRCGSASKGIRVLERAEYEQLSGQPEADNYLFQRYVADRTEYTVDCFVSIEGQFVCAVPRVRLEVAGGEVTTTETLHDEEIERWSRTILSVLDLRGPITIQFLRDNVTGRVMLMEINPRLGGGAVCSVCAGADLPAYILADWMHNRVAECDNWKSGIRICRYQQEVVFDTNN